MSERTVRKNKIGARCLSEREAELILPTYRQIYKQIEQFRSEKESGSGKGKDRHDKDQKTNNIGIIGARGAGKTSILKTVRAELIKKKSESGECGKDIILPIIVPENMSESSTLMATILGMLKDVVEECAKKQRKEERHLDCPGKEKIKKEYDEVVKQYTFIQKEYRDILIREYTTENDYANSSSKVFNSDSEFISKFNELINELVNDEKGQGLLFIFIDDIDLSTYRCGDVVKTLLSYLSNENIVTFISGDLETFEEALTLEFLRKEKVLDKGILGESMLPGASGDSTVIRRKMGLSYEYLKKIIPPVFRHNVKEWSLRERGKYCIFDSEERGKECDTLSDLLLKALEGWVEPAYFKFREYQKQEEEVLPYTFHLFDRTSRGLNNVYNVLNEIAEKRKGGENGQADALNQKKQLLDTIVSSKQVFNQHRDEIQKRMFNIGVDKQSSKVFFDNANTIIYREENKEKEKKEESRPYCIADPVERFSLFILVDFAARLLYEKDYFEITDKDEYYKKLKENAMEDLFFNPEISEKVMEVSAFRWEREEEKPERRKLVLQDLLKINDLNKNFLVNGELALNMAYYYNLMPEKIWGLYTLPKADNKMPDISMEQHIAVAFWKGLFSVCSVNNRETVNVLMEYYPVFEREFAYIQNRFSNSLTQNVAISLFEKECEEAAKENVERYYSQRILANTIAFLLQEDEKNDNVRKELLKVQLGLAITNKGEIIPEEDNKNSNTRNFEDIKRRIGILESIDSQNLWKDEVMESVITYVTREIKEYLKGIGGEFSGRHYNKDREWKLDTKCAEDSWKEFDESYDGVSRTLSRELKQDIANVLDAQNTFEQGISYKKFIDIVDLTMKFTRKRAWYGKHEAQIFLNNLLKSPALLKEDKTDSDARTSTKGVYSYLTFLLQCSYKYKMEMRQEANIKDEAEILKSIMDTLPQAQGEADDHVLTQFIGKLNTGMEKKVDKDEFEKLFS